MSKYHLLPLLAASLLFGCGAEPGSPPASPFDLDALRLQVGAQARSLVERLEAAASALEEDRLIRALLGGCEGAVICSPSSLSNHLGSLATLFFERALREENFVEARGRSLLFRPRGEASCEVGDLRCVALLHRLDLDLWVQPLPEEHGLILSVQRGPHRPLIMRLFEGELAVEVDLLELEPLLGAVGEHSGPALPFELDRLLLLGRLEVVLTATDAGRVELQLSVLEPVEIVGPEPGALRLSMDAAIPAALIAFDPALGQVQVEAHLAAMELGGPLSSFLSHELPPPGRLDLFVAGLEGEASWLSGEGPGLLTIQGLGFGGRTSRGTLDGAPLLAFDLNPEDGRRADLQLSVDPELGRVLQVVPGLEIELALHLANLADRLEVPSWALDESLRLELSEAPAPALLLRGGQDRAPSIEVLAGRLLLEARSSQEAERPRRIVVEEGMCLAPHDRPEATWPTDAVDEEGHPFDRLGAGVCR